MPDKEVIKPCWLYEDVKSKYKFASPMDVHVGEYILLKEPSMYVSPKYVPKQVVKETKASIWLKGQETPLRRAGIKNSINESHEVCCDLLKNYGLRFRLTMAIGRLTLISPEEYVNIPSEELLRFVNTVEELGNLLMGFIRKEMEKLS